MKNIDVILINTENDNIYPLAHADSNNEIIPNTYQRKEVNIFTIKKGSNWEELTTKSGKCYKHVLTTELYPLVAKVKEEDNPLWDILINPEDKNVDYKDQIKFRAWCTNLITHNGSMDLISMNIPTADIKLYTLGLKLNG